MEKFRNWVRPEAGLSKRRWTVPRVVSTGGVKVRVKGVQSVPIGERREPERPQNMRGGTALPSTWIMGPPAVWWTRTSRCASPAAR